MFIVELILFHFTFIGGFKDLRVWIFGNFIFFANLLETANFEFSLEG